MTLQDWIKAARPKTLGASWIPVVVGTSIAYKTSGIFDFYIFSCTVVASIFIQIATNYINDAIDFKKGADTHLRMGPQRLTASGKVSASTMLRGGIFCLLVASFLGLQLIFKAGVPILLIGVFSVIMAYSYTGGPFPLAYLGLGDIFVLLFFGVIAVVGSFFVQVEKMSFYAVLGGIQIGLLAVVLIAINNFRDMEHDKQANKKTLAVRFGAKFMKTEILFCLLMPFLLQLLWMRAGYIKAALWPLATLPLALYIFIKIYKTKPSVQYNKFLANAGILQMAFGILLSLGLLIK